VAHASAHSSSAGGTLKGRVIRIGLVAIVGIALAAGSFSYRRNAEANLRAAQQRAMEESAAAARLALEHRDTVSEVRIPSGAIFTQVLRKADIDPQAADQITEAVRPVFNTRRMRAGEKLVFVRHYTGELRSIHYRTGWDSELRVAKEDNGFVASEKKLEAVTETQVVQGKIESSLFESVLATGEHPELAVRLAEIFAYDLDFYSDPQPGDTFRLVFEKRTVPGEDTPYYGQIYAAEYVNGSHPYNAVLFRDPNGRPAYYTADGKSLQKAFLHSPLKFAARVSSHFSKRRFHPVAHVFRPHLGTDYAAAVGTPVQAIASGRVIFSGRKGGNGNLVVLRHANGYESYYLHLSRLLVRVGQNVQQGQRIGLVGMTGLASGPHLDFRMKKNGTFVNFERLKLPPANPVAKSDLPAFYVERDKWMALLNQPPAPTHVASSEPTPTTPPKPGTAD
jgi:murein DD-endopeptidase MepM/ murein hydrolase activator NlpD